MDDVCAEDSGFEEERGACVEGNQTEDQMEDGGVGTVTNEGCLAQQVDFQTTQTLEIIDQRTFHRNIKAILACSYVRSMGRRSFLPHIAAIFPFLKL